MVVYNGYMNKMRIESGNSTVRPSVPLQKPLSSQKSFSSLLKEKIEEKSEIKFSKHAEMRLKMRSINLSESQKAKIASALDKAREKGIRDSLIIVDNMAFIANVKNRTIVTAVQNGELEENVFTNIDGAVFA